MSDPLRNPDPNYVRAPDWKYEEDWDSPAWRNRMSLINSRIGYCRNAFGFADCPACKTWHTGKTLMCRGCSHSAEVPIDPLWKRFMELWDLTPLKTEGLKYGDIDTQEKLQAVVDFWEKQLAAERLTDAPKTGE